MVSYSFSPKKKSVFDSLSVTLILVLINVVFFVIVWGLMFAGVISNNFFNNNIALSLANVKSLRIWTFLTSMFMHGGLFHIFANMFSLVFIGSFIERILGRKRYFWFYMVSGLFAGVLYIFFEFLFPSGLGAVGASGALFGIAGLMMILTPNIPLYVMFIPIPIKAKYAIPGLLVVLWFISVAGSIPIGNTAHLGGLVAGVVYGIYLRKKYKKKTRYISQHFS